MRHLILFAVLGLMIAGSSGCRTREYCTNHDQCGNDRICDLDTNYCIPGTCGDGIIKGEETCDDGNTTDGDGCSADCKSDETCGNGIVDMATGEACDDGNTTDGDGCQANCSLQTCGDGVVDTGEVCDDGNTTSGDGCNEHCTSDETCGNSIVDLAVGEACDDGNTTGGDGCSPACHLETCGNGVVDTGEICDDGNNIDGDGCSASCLSDETCGNGFIDVPVGEACDDGNTTGGDGCSPFCHLESCGNGVVDPGEVCDDGNTTDGDGCSANCLSDETCGNGFIDLTVGEACDDGNATDWDGCTTCALSEFQVNSYTTYDQLSPAVAFADDGRFVVAWQSDGQDGSYDGIFAQRYDALGQPDGAEFQVNTCTADDQGGPAVAMADNGRFVVAWQSDGQDGDREGIFAQRYDALGQPDGAEFQVNTYTTNDQSSPAAAMAGDGRLVVAWQSSYQDGSVRGVFAQRYDALGQPAGGEFQVNTYTTSDQLWPAVAMADDGRFVVVWQSTGQDGNGNGVFAQRYDTLGQPDGGEFQVNTYTDGNQGDPVVAIADDGRFVVVWSGNGQDGVLYDIYAQRYDTLGQPDGGEFQVNTYMASIQAGAEVAMAGDGRFIVAWRSDGQDGDQYGVFGRLYDAFGQPAGSEFQVSIYTAGNQWSQALDMTDDGRFAVAWSSHVQDGSLYGVYAQRYSATGDMLGQLPW